MDLGVQTGSIVASKEFKQGAEREGSAKRRFGPMRWIRDRILSGMRAAKGHPNGTRSAISGGGRSATKRRLRLESLESRRLLIAEGQTFPIDQTLDTSDFLGTLSASIQWGDGTTTAATIQNPPTVGALKVRIDYSLDTSGFFNDPARREILQTAADLVVSKFTDTLSAIQPASGDMWQANFRNPSTGDSTSRTNLSIAQNEILVFAGARALGGTEGGIGNRGGFSASSTRPAFLTAVQTRGNPGAIASPATDNAPWGGSIAFDTSKNWYFGASPTNLQSNQLDFLSVAVHEFNHIMGFGTTPSFDNKLVNGKFTGAAARAVFGADVGMGDSDHFLESILVDGRPPVMAPVFQLGQRVTPTRLDLAALDDIGWDLAPQTVRVLGNKVYGDNGTFSGVLTLTGSRLGSRSIPFNAAITNAAPILQTPANTTATVGVPLSLPRIGVFTDAGFGVPNATPPRSESFTYRIDWGDATAADTGNATISAVGSATSPTSGFFDGSHTYTRAGSYTVTLSVSDDDGGTSQRQFTILVSEPPRLTVSIDKTSFREDAGTSAALLTVSRSGGNLAQAMTVALVSSDTTEVTLPASVILPANQSSITVSVSAIDDTLLDGTQRVNLSATSGNLQSNVVSVDVLDAEQLQLTIDRASFSEAAGAGVAVLTVRRGNTDLTSPLTVQLTSSDTTEATVPSSVVIPAGASSTTIGVNAIDDALFDGSQTVVFTPSANGYTSIVAATATVTDFQPITLVAVSTALNEDIVGQQSTQTAVSIRSPAPTGGVTVQLSAVPAGILSFPATVVIPAGSTGVNVTVAAINNNRPDDPRTVTLTATGNNLVARDLVFTVRDTDPAPWTNPRNRFDVNDSGGVDPLDVLAIINEINRNGTRTLDPVADAGLPFVDVGRDGAIDPLDVLAVINEINRGL